MYYSKNDYAIRGSRRSLRGGVRDGSTGVMDRGKYSICPYHVIKAYRSQLRAPCSIVHQHFILFSCIVANFVNVGRSGILCMWPDINSWWYLRILDYAIVYGLASTVSEQTLHTRLVPRLSWSVANCQWKRKMNAIVALCHFCEAHGPCIMFCTQVCVSLGEVTVNCNVASYNVCMGTGWIHSNRGVNHHIVWFGFISLFSCIVTLYWVMYIIPMYYVYQSLLL